MIAPHPAPRPSAPRPSLRWGLAAAWAVFVAVLLWAAGPEGPAPWTWIDRFQEAGGDKLVHAALFLVQAWLLSRCRPGAGRAGWLIASVGIAVGFGVVTELGQLVVPGRDATVGDALADTVGAGAGAVLYAWRSRRT